MPRRILLFALPLAAGLVGAIALTMPGTARAWDINALPTGYYVEHLTGQENCDAYLVWTTYSPETLGLHSCVPGWTGTLDAYVERTCPASVCHPAPPTPTSSDTTPVTSTTPVTTDVTTTAPPVTVTTTDTTVTQPAPTPPTVTQTVLVQTVLVDPTINVRLTLLEQQQAVDQARLDALEHPTGQILGEPKNVAPFVTGPAAAAA